MTLHSKITPAERPQNTPEVPTYLMQKSCIWDKFSLMGLTKQIFSTALSPNLGQLPHPSTQNRMGNLTTRLVESISNLIYRLLIDYKKPSNFTSLVLVANLNGKSCFNGLLSTDWSNLNDSNRGPPRNSNYGSGMKKLALQDLNTCLQGSLKAIFDCYLSL